MIAALWLLEHDARLKQSVELQQQRRATTVEVVELRARAEAAMNEFRASAQVIESLETRGRALERDAVALRQKLRSLREEERIRVQSASTLGQAELSGRVLSRLGPAEFGTRDSEYEGETGNRKLETGDPSFQFPISSFAQASPESPAPSPSLASCREQAGVQDQLLSNCEQRVEINRAALEAAKQSALSLQQALRAKDEIAVQLDAQHRAELQAARGSRLRRFGRALRYVGAGVVVGVVMAR